MNNDRPGDPFYNDVLPLSIIVMAIAAIWLVYLLS